MVSRIPSWKRGEPADQAYFTFTGDAWHPIEATASTSPPGSETPTSFQFSVLSWNIDFMRPLEEARMSAALKHLHSLVSQRGGPSIIMLNEMVESDLRLIKAADWVRQGYHLTDISVDHWESPRYGTCMLVPRALPIKDVFRVHYERTSMQRDALFVDIALPESRTLRLCTTHLESLRRDPPRRPSQLAAAAAYLQPGRGAHAGVLAGDLNAIEPFDRTLHAENGLRDAYLDRGGREGADEGMTWGPMAAAAERERFGLSRMDKVLFCGRLELLDFARFGMDVQVEDEDAGRQLMAMTRGLEKPWVTDHLGVRAEFRIDLPLITTDDASEGAVEGGGNDSAG